MSCIVIIEGMGCSHCVNAVERALADINGIHNLKVSVGKAEFEGNPDEAEIKKAIDDAGYGVIEIKKGE